MPKKQKPKEKDSGSVFVKTKEGGVSVYETLEPSPEYPNHPYPYHTLPNVIVESDNNGYFENKVRSWLSKKIELDQRYLPEYRKPWRCATIVIHARLFVIQPVTCWWDWKVWWPPDERDEKPILHIRFFSLLGERQLARHERILIEQWF
jgi:hypothetical protein